MKNTTRFPNRVAFTFNLIFIFAALLTTSPVRADKLVLTDAQLLQKAGLNPIKTDTGLGIAAAILTSDQEAQLSQIAHKSGRCAGFEDLGEISLKSKLQAHAVLMNKIDQELAMLRKAQRAADKINFKPLQLKEDSQIRDAVEQVDAQKIKSTVDMLVSFGGRYHAATDPNRHVRALEGELKKMAQAAKYPVTVQVLTHRRTSQNSLSMRLEGRLRPREIVALGGHLDSINHEWGRDRNQAPGADDNASGSATLVEIARILLNGEQPERSIEFFWYAAEEVGLWGSAEIASQYASQTKDVIGVMQLDMVLHPGSGVGTISNVADFTNAWLRAHLEEVNQIYVKARMISDTCGYACSDHASWHKQGYPAVMPFESHTDNMNGAIHTVSDKVSASSNFIHAATFAKLGVAYALTLANSDLRAPK